MLRGAQSFFVKELQRMNLMTTKHQAIQKQFLFVDETRDAELQELALALKRAKVSGEEATNTLRSHSEARDTLAAFLKDLDAWEYSKPWIHDDGEPHRGEAPTPSPAFPPIEIAPGLPDEFADYFEGALAWHNPALEDKQLARQSWERLLARPEPDRKYKSVWAAFMLGRSWAKQDPQKATNCFAQCRSLASRGFPDPVGLAAASLGLEARVHLHNKQFLPAIDLYLQQMAANDNSAATSLRFTAAAALRGDPGVLRQLANHPRAQRVITAFVISHRAIIDESDEAVHDSLTRKWLEAIEAAGVKDADSAEKLALAAYQANEMDLAQRWIKLSQGAPVAQWLQAKLLLRAGKLEQAAALLGRVARSFPVEPRGTNELTPVSLKDTLSTISHYGALPIERQVLGELGVLRLARREFTQSLDALLNAGFWMDAAYVAERVLTVDELKAYVDQHWPPVSPGQLVHEMEMYPEDDISPAKLRRQIRYLLARRLTRSSRSEEARAYYPDEWLPQFDAFIQSLTTGWDPSRSAEDRANGLFAAAIITRTNGMELIGTEVEPDWFIHEGNYAEGVSIAVRAENDRSKVLVATEEELRRAAQHDPTPNERFHYRYQAASLAWEAAKLLPDNSDSTAYILWRAGSWLKKMDPRTADIFYKALVRRNRQTALGAEADRQRWFPVLDIEGRIIPRPKSGNAAENSPNVTPIENTGSDPSAAAQPAAPVESVEASQAAPNSASEGEQMAATQLAQHFYRYTVEKGDSLSSIARALSQAGIFVRLEDLVEANPGLESDRLKVGQVILIPVPETAQ